ncbi:MAG: SDH family Clp fold serine proteinase [Aminivibrio sp.]|jgi:ClpP class serine protease
MQSSIWMYFLLIFIIFPQLKQHLLQWRRVTSIKNCEKRRGTRIITLIHRQETMGFWGMFSRNFINIEDSEEVLRAIRLTSENTPIDLIIHTPGGLLLAAEQIARALKRHPSKVTVVVPHYAMSGGTLIALAADEILMDRHAVLGPVDPQIGRFPAASILKTVEAKPIKDVDDETLILADVSKKALKQTRNLVFELVSERLGEEKGGELATTLTDGRWTHDYPITVDEAASLGLPVVPNDHDTFCNLMSLYPQAASARPSVQYVPAPYPNRPSANGRRDG